MPNKKGGYCCIKICMPISLGFGPKVGPFMVATTWLVNSRLFSNFCGVRWACKKAKKNDL